MSVYLKTIGLINMFLTFIGLILIVAFSSSSWAKGTPVIFNKVFIDILFIIFLFVFAPSLSILFLAVGGLLDKQKSSKTITSHYAADHPIQTTSMQTSKSNTSLFVNKNSSESIVEKVLESNLTPKDKRIELKTYYKEGKISQYDLESALKKIK